MMETISCYTDCRHKSSFIICVYLRSSADKHLNLGKLTSLVVKQGKW
jgi:hypothetical protein